MSPLVAITTTLASEAEAIALAKRVLDDRLAACVQIESIQSFYTWKDAIHQETEWRVLLKTAKRRAEALIAFLEAHHPYEQPEILLTEISFASESYIAWVQAMTREHD